MAVTKIWDVRGSLDAPIKYVSNEEKTETGVTREIQKIEVVIRQTPQTKRMASTAYRIRFDGIEYDITGIIPNYTTQDYMKLLCESRRAGAKDDVY